MHGALLRLASSLRNLIVGMYPDSGSQSPFDYGEYAAGDVCK